MPAHRSRMVRAAWRVLAPATLLSAAACANPGSPSGAAANAPPPQPVAAPSASPAVTPAPAPASASAPPASASDEAPIAPSASAASSGAAPAESAAPEPLPAVKVVNIGMHIGGGPNDNETKAPIRSSVQPHFDAFRACWRSVVDKTKEGDFGVDLLIPADGGKAEVSHPRTALKGDGFTDCMVKAFEAIDFQKPRKGKTKVSYSLRFTPERK